MMRTTGNNLTWAGGAVIAVAMTSLTGVATSAGAATETVLYSFGGSGAGDGQGPTAGLIHVGTMWYGTTSTGGSGFGTIFSVDKLGNETVQYSFAGSPGDGQNPVGGLINVNGTLYGTTEFGGTGTASAGTVFSYNIKTATETVLYSFKGGVFGDGEHPMASLINVGGTLYGTTYGGGAHDAGTVFSVKPKTGFERVVYPFQGGSVGDGEEPTASLINVNGTLYGTTEFGGSNGTGSGTVFSINPKIPNSETVLYSFGGGGAGDGEEPTASLIRVGYGKNTMLYGTTTYGGSGQGTVFSVDLSGNETVLYSFGSVAGDGQTPAASLINVNGTLYGTTEYGGAVDLGTVFSVNIKNQTETVLHSFLGSRGNDGEEPTASLTPGSPMYGTTEFGGSNGTGSGTVFTFKP